MSTLHHFESLGGVSPGVSTLSEVVAQLGTEVTETSDGRLFIFHDGICVECYDRHAPEQIVDEVELWSLYDAHLV